MAAATIPTRDVVIYLTLAFTAGCILAALNRRWLLSLTLGGVAIAGFWGYWLGGLVG